MQAVARQLPAGCVRLDTRVDSIDRSSDGSWRLTLTEPAAGGTTIECDGVVAAIGAPHAARMLTRLDPQLSAKLNRITYAGTSIVSLAYRREDIGLQLTGFGFVVPAVENRRILAGSFSSVKFSGRAPDGWVLVRVFIGGACQSELAELPDAQLQRLATEELSSLLKTRGAPRLCDICAGRARCPSITSATASSSNRSKPPPPHGRHSSWPATPTTESESRTASTAANRQPNGF